MAYDDRSRCESTLHRWDEVRAVSEALLWSMVPGASREFATVHPYETAALNVFYGEVTYPVRGVVEMAVGLDTPMSTSATRPPRIRKFAAWRMMEDEGYRVSEIIEFLGEWYFMQTKRRAQYAFVKSLPKGVPQGDDTERCIEVDGLMLMVAEWCLEKCVMVGG